MIHQKLPIIQKIKKHSQLYVNRILGREQKKFPKVVIWGLFLLTCLVIGLLISVVIYNKIEQQKETFLEVTFVTPRQAIVFWKTEHKAIGYVKYGANKKNLDMIAHQTSSVPGFTHAVILDTIPLEGLYISIHTESESPFLWERPLEIQFDPTTIE